MDYPIYGMIVATLIQKLHSYSNLFCQLQFDGKRNCCLDYAHRQCSVSSEGGAMILHRTRVTGRSGWMEGLQNSDFNKTDQDLHPENVLHTSDKELSNLTKL